jgi:putative NADH-flavin reductase
VTKLPSLVFALGLLAAAGIVFGSVIAASGQTPAATGGGKRVALIGASGKVGSRVLAELVSRGYTVTGIGRNPESVPAGPHVTAAKGDVGEPAALAKVLAGHDAIISAVPFLTTDPDALIGAVRTSGVKRYIVVGGAATLLNDKGVRLLDTPPLSTMDLPEPAAGARFLERLRLVSDLDWTFFSPAVQFTAGERTGKFRLGGDQVVTDAAGKSRISFEDYAIALVDELDKPAHIRKRFTIGY